MNFSVLPPRFVCFFLLYNSFTLLDFTNYSLFCIFQTVFFVKQLKISNIEWPQEETDEADPESDQDDDSDFSSDTDSSLMSDTDSDTDSLSGVDIIGVKAMGNYYHLLDNTHTELEGQCLTRDFGHVDCSAPLPSFSKLLIHLATLHQYFESNTLTQNQVPEVEEGQFQPTDQSTPSKLIDRLHASIDALKSLPFNINFNETSSLGPSRQRQLARFCHAVVDLITRTLTPDDPFSTFTLASNYKSSDNFLFKLFSHLRKKM